MRIKHFLFAIAFTLLASCSVTQSISEEDFNRFDSKGQVILFEGKEIAKVKSVEMEYFEGKSYLEVSVEQLYVVNYETSELLLRYLAKKYPKSKIEVQFVDQNQQNEFLNK